MLEKSRCRTTRLVPVAVAALVAASSLLLYAATGVISSFKIAGADHIYVTGINASGTIAGNWFGTDGLRHGFLRSPAHVITTIDEPDAGTDTNDGTYIYGINDLGQVTGAYSCVHTSSDVQPCAYVRDEAGNFTSFTVPGAFASYGQGINNAGVIAGVYSPPGNGSYLGFLRDAAGNITTFGVPKAAGITVYAINAQSQIVGSYSAVTSDHGFLRSPAGKITTFDPPQAVHTYAMAISNDGAVAGYYIASTDQSAVRHAFYRDAAGNITTFDAPGAGTDEDEGTYALGINSAGTITGYYSDSNFVNHGFVRYQSGEIVTFDDPNAAQRANLGTLPCCINRLGQIAGSFLQGTKSFGGFIRK